MWKYLSVSFSLIIILIFLCVEYFNSLIYHTERCVEVCFEEIDRWNEFLSEW